MIVAAVVRMHGGSDQALPGLDASFHQSQAHKARHRLHQSECLSCRHAACRHLLRLFDPVPISIITFDPFMRQLADGLRSQGIMQLSGATYSRLSSPVLLDTKSRIKRSNAIVYHQQL